MIVLHGKTRLDLDPSMVIGAGGEATVFAIDQTLVAKIWHAPTPEHARKLARLLRRGAIWPSTIAAPIAELRAPKGNAVVGALMPRVPTAFAPLATLLQKGARETFGMSLSDVVELLLSVAATVDDLHRRGIVVGDLNDQNELWSGGEHRLVDVDSFQLDGEPCSVATEAYLDPALYDVDLGKSAAFSPGNDHYALAVLAFRALVGAHPFGGTHPMLASIPARARAGVLVFDPSVKYPAKIARPPAVLSGDLHAWFSATFLGGMRQTLPASLLRELARESVACGSCGLVAPRSLVACPSCSTKNKTVVHAHPSGVTAEQVFEAKGAILHVELLGSTICIVSAEEGRLVRYLLRGAVSDRHDLGAHAPRTRFAVLSGGEVAVANGEVVVLHACDGSVVLETTTSEVDGAPVISACGSALLRIAGGAVLAGTPRGGALVERVVTTALDRQTWISGSASHDVVLGVDRIFRRKAPFFISRGARVDLAAPPLHDDEHETAAEMLWNGKSALYLRETTSRTGSHVRTDLFGDDGALISSARSPRDTGARASIRGRAFQGTTLLHPTDDGIARERLVPTGSALAIIPGTEPHVSQASLLSPHPRGLFVATGRSLSLLRIV